ncbi:MAG: hypothetical protein AABO57_11115 [Acidobacteriota bacterium]
MRIVLQKSFLLAVILLSNASGAANASLSSAYAPELNRGQLIAAARAGGDYLIRMQRRDGSFHYYYDPAQDRFESRRYNIVRHAGTALSLLDLYAATRDGRYLESSRRAITFLKTRLKSVRSGEAAYVLDYDGKAKLGANGLALAALAKQIELDRKTADRKSAARLANLILAMQRRDGSFESRYRLRTGDPEGIASLYYPGEAILGLILFYRSNGDKRLLDCARRGADYLIESQRMLGALPPDAWLMQALEALYNIGREKKYAEHSIALAEAMIADQYSESDPAGYSGGFGPGPPRATPAAARAEGLVAAYRVARSTGDSRAAKIAGSLKACASFQLAQQFSVRNSTSLPNPRRAAGGFREGLTSMKIRIDFVQHNISSLVGIAKALY